MTEIRELVEKLKLIGLSEYAAKAYLAIVKIGKGTAPDIAKMANIPKAKVYEVLEDLNEKGFVGKQLNEKPTMYFAYRPLRRFKDWLKQFEDLAEYLETIYNRSSAESEKGYYVIGNFEGKLNAKDFLYIFEQNDKLYKRFFNGSSKNYYQIGGTEARLLAIGKKQTILLSEREHGIQFLSLESDIFYKIIDLLMLLAPGNRSITQTMLELSNKEPILYVDTIITASGVIFGNNGKIWITSNRIFIQFAGKNIYARPLSSISSCEISSNGAINIEISRKDGEKEVAEIFTYSDPRIIKNILKIL